MTTPGSVRYNPTGQAVDVISTVNGGREASWAIYRGGGLVGMESTNTRPPAEVPIDFVDWPFSKQDDQSFEDHLQVVKKERPMYAVAPDIEGDVTAEQSLEWADQLNQYAGVVIVVPKDVHPEVVSDEYRVGIPCQDRFGGVPWSVWEYRNCAQVHLLGGSPTRHKEFQNYLNIRSVDTASVVKAAYCGSAWKESGWYDVDAGFYGSLEASIDGMTRFWNGGASTFGTLRVAGLPADHSSPDQCDNSIQSTGCLSDSCLRIKYSGELEAIEELADFDEMPFPPSDTLSPDDQVPFPGRAVFYQN